MKNRKEDIIFVAVLVVLVLIFVGFKIIRGKKAEAPVTTTEETVVAPEADQTATKVSIVRKKKSDTIWPELSYTETFVKYQNGYLLQFSPNCQARPVSLAVKNGSEVMLDNRGNQKVDIVIGNTTHKLEAYGYEVIKITSKDIPASYGVDCNGSQNVTTVVVE